MTQTSLKINNFPPLRGRLTENAPLGEKGWFRTGGTADILYKPADLEDLQTFLAALPPETPLHMFGVLSNTIIRDGGLPGVTIRFGSAFAKAEPLKENRIRAGALTLDATVAKTAQDSGIAGLEFYTGIPGTIGGALRMNAGCYGTETKDVLAEATALDRKGNLIIFTPASDSQPGPGGTRLFAAETGQRMTLTYRHNDLPEDMIFVSAVFEGQPGNPDEIAANMAEIRARREQSQPIREKTGGSTFANPSAGELAAAGLPPDTKVWQLIDRAGCRGLTVGGAMMSEKHCNFMINTGTATAADLEDLGEEVRRRVLDQTGITLRWEVKRLGRR